MKKDSMLYTVLFTFIVCVFFVFFLALANELTKGRVAENKRFAEHSAILLAFGIPYPSSDQVDAVYERSVTSSGSGSSELFRAQVGGSVLYAKRFSGPALWGTVTGILAVNASVDRIEGLRIVSHNETPGLGGRIDEAWFQDQFRGERIGPNGIRVRQGSGKGDADHENGELDAVTGASRTSQAIETIVNSEISTFRAIRDEGGLK